MNTKLIIPENILVGFQERTDTYSGKLGYVVFKEGSKIRKVKSWTSWRDDKIDPGEFENEPTEGFVLNRDIGGKRHSYSSWDMRMEKVRVYDPRGFEIEITIPNVLFILQECSSIKGKGIEGELVYSWNGAELILLPVCSLEYKESLKYTKKKAKKFPAKLLRKGHLYELKDHGPAMYLGKEICWRTYSGPSGKFAHVFKPQGDKHYEVYVTSSDASIVASELTDKPEQNYAEEVINLQNTRLKDKGRNHYYEIGKAVSLKLDVNERYNWRNHKSTMTIGTCQRYYKTNELIFVEENGKFYRGKKFKEEGNTYEDPGNFEITHEIFIKDGEVCRKLLKPALVPTRKLTDADANRVCGRVIVTNEHGTEKEIR